MSGGKSNLLLYYPQQWFEYTDLQRKEISNGCGPGGWKYDLVPDKILWCDVTKACDIHDFMYHIGETEEDRNRADRVFKNNLLRIIRSQNSIRVVSVLRQIISIFYYSAVSWFGGPSFWDNKEDPADVILTK